MHAIMAYQDVVVYCHSFLTTDTMRVSDHLHALAALLLGSIIPGTD
jgi:hypothetical protein